MPIKKRKLLTIVGLAFVLFMFSGCGGKNVSKKIAAEDYSHVITAKTIPDMGLFFGREYVKQAEESFDRGTQYVSLTMDGAADIMLEYINLLVEEFEFEIVGGESFDLTQEDPFCGQFDTGRWSVAMVSHRINAGREQKCVYSGESCDLYVRGYEQEGLLSYSSVLEIEDTGHRRSGYEGDTLNDFVGAHALDAFGKKGGKYYSKDDRNFAVKAKKWTEYEFRYDKVDYVGAGGYAAVSINGEQAEQGTAAIVFGQSGGDPHYEIELSEFTSSETGEKISLKLPPDTGEGEVYFLSDFISGHQQKAEKNTISLSYTPNYAASEFEAGAYTSVRSSVEALSIRILRMPKDKDDPCLILLGMKAWYDGDPVEIECLIAAPINDAEHMESAAEQKKSSSSSRSSSSDSTYSPNVAEFAKLDCLTCGGDGDCNTCGGYGEVERYAGGGDTVTSKCSSCYGSGNCRTCGGSGKRD